MYDTGGIFSARFLFPVNFPQILYLCRFFRKRPFSYVRQNKEIFSPQASSREEAQ